MSKKINNRLKFFLLNTKKRKILPNIIVNLQISRSKLLSGSRYVERDTLCVIFKVLEEYDRLRKNIRREDRFE